jgi:hypothetical protein
MGETVQREAPANGAQYTYDIVRQLCASFDGGCGRARPRLRERGRQSQRHANSLVAVAEAGYAERREILQVRQPLGPRRDPRNLGQRLETVPPPPNRRVGRDVAQGIDGEPSMYRQTGIEEA